MNISVLSPFSSQESNKSFAGPAVFNYQLDPEDDITSLLDQLYDLAQVKFDINFVLYFKPDIVGNSFTKRSW